MLTRKYVESQRYVEKQGQPLMEIPGRTSMYTNDVFLASKVKQ